MLKHVAVLTAALLLVPAVAADHGTDAAPTFCFDTTGGGIVGVVLGASAAATCLALGFVDAASHLTLCLLLGGSNC